MILKSQTFFHKEIKMTENINELKTKAENGDFKAQSELGDCYYYGKKGFERNYAEAIKYYRKAAENGDGYAKSRLRLIDPNFKESLNTLKDLGNMLSETTLTILELENSINKAVLKVVKKTGNTLKNITKATIRKLEKFSQDDK